MFHLPEEIIRLIYEYDNTYKEIFDKVLHSRFDIYRNENNSYLIFDNFSGKSFITDSLKTPTWKTTHHTHKKKEKNDTLYMENFRKKMMNYYQLEKVSEILEYDIYESLYSRT
jgi:hypothetical protein